MQHEISEEYLFLSWKYKNQITIKQTECSMEWWKHRSPASESALLLLIVKFPLYL